MEDIVIKVSGMHCEGCENRIKNAVGSLDNVESVVADHKTGTVTVKGNVSRKEVEDTIEDIGFEVEDK